MLDQVNNSNPMDCSQRMSRMSRMVGKDGNIVSTKQVEKQLTMAEQLELAGKNLKPALKKSATTIQPAGKAKGVTVAPAAQNLDRR
jgi:hypothetical protein